MSSASGTDCVKVAVRVRPFVSREIDRGCVQIVEKTPGEEQLEVTGDSHSKSQDLYAFNNVFMPHESQETVYNNSIKPIITKLFEGYNVTILAYGQTGSGKTYSMGTVFDGDWESPKVGIIPRALRDIFTTIQNEEKNSIITVSCSFMELYQEILYDLLATRPRQENICEIRENGIKGIYIDGLSEVSVANEAEATKCLMKGGNCRSIGATAMNDTSSRSHAIFTVNITKTRFDGTGKTSAKFHLVDLAGSERSKKTQATGMRFKEGVKINQGLLALGNVISALGGGSSGGGYISYRDSKLTRLLQDSLGGNSVTVMVACVSPADYNIEETLSTLRYADRAKKIKNKPVKNEDTHAGEVAKLKHTIQDLRMQLMNSGNQVASGVKGSESGSDSTSTCEAACKDKTLKREKEVLNLKRKLNMLLNSMNDLNALHVVEEAFINDFIATYEAFRDKILHTCSAEYAMPDTNIFNEIREKADEIQNMISNFKQQIKTTFNESHSAEISLNLTDDADNQKYNDFTNNQIEMFSQLTTLDRDLKIKQELLERKFLNVPLFEEDSDKTMLEYESTIKTLEKELEELRGTTSTARRELNATKVNMDRKHKLEKLEKELNEVRKKCVALEKNKKIAMQDRKRIDDLRREIEEMKKARVQLVRQQRSDSESYKRFIASRDKEINCLKEKGRKVQNDMKRMERLHEKQQAVLKRKVEEAKAMNKRLQDLQDRGRKIQKERLEKTVEKRADVVQTYIDHELTVLLTSIDVKKTMQSLMTDRGLLLERLQNLKSTVSKTPELEMEITQLEEDLEMRNAQITDMRGKLAETDIEAKIKNIPDNFGSTQELRIAMSYILRAVADAREDFITNKSKAEELKTAFESSEERVELLTEEKNEMELMFKNEKANIERDFDQKLNLFLQKRSGNIDKTDEERCFTNLTDQLTAKFEEIAQLKESMRSLELKLAAQEKGGNNEQPIKKKMKKQLANGTYLVDSSDASEKSDNDDEEEEFNFDDSFNDPDWKKTPAMRAKRASRATTTLLKESLANRFESGNNILIDISESSDSGSSSAAPKRTSSGQIKCSCKGSCATKQCGCKKGKYFCSDSCKCSHACVNQPNVSNHDNDDVEPEKENDKTPEKNTIRSRDMKDITTPYYPYESKKRRPLLSLE